LKVNLSIMQWPRSYWFVRFSFLSVFYISIQGCSAISYYSQSVAGQMSVIYHREAIDDVINDPNEKDTLKEKLRLVKSIRQYATRTLYLPDNKSYLYYTDLKRPYVVWNVFSAPEFSLKPINWCYPIIGCVSYRGYFDKQNAQDYAQTLSDEGHDIYVAGIAAYSTLGWFNDPFLSSMIHWRDRSLAGLIFHELSHQVIYVSNETAFNEAFSSAVERIGSLQWLLDTNPTGVEHYMKYLYAQGEFRDLLLQTKNELEVLYASDASIEVKRDRKELVFRALRVRYEQLKKSWPENIHFDYWFKQPITNARFIASMTYLDKIPAFYALFVQSNGSWQDFYRKIIEIGEMEKSERDELISHSLQKQNALPEILALLKKQQL